MTLEEIQRQIDAARAAPINPDGTSDYFNLLPRVYYKDLPKELREEADRITIDMAKRFLLECYSVGMIESVINADQAGFTEKITEALHAARYLIESTDLTPPNPTGNPAADTTALEALSPLSLMGADFIEAWEKTTGIAQTITADEVRAALSQLTSIIPQKHIIPNNKLANSLTQDIIDAGVISLDVGKKKGDIITRCLLSYEGDNVKLTSRQPFTEYDRNVADAVTSLYEYGDESHVITAATVYRAMVHATETETPSPQQIGAVTRSLDKMRFVRVQIDCSEELTRRKLSLNGAQVTGGKIDTYLLALEKIEVIAGGQKVTAYKVMKAPILYDYSRLTGQVLTVPAALLDIRDDDGAKVANTERRIAVKGHLMRRIERMKGKSGSTQSRHILYTDVYASVCEDAPKEKEQRLIREYIALVLNSWKRDGYIKGYSELTQGRKKTGVEIKI